MRCSFRLEGIKIIGSHRYQCDLQSWFAFADSTYQHADIQQKNWDHLKRQILQVYSIVSLQMLRRCFVATNFWSFNILHVHKNWVDIFLFLLYLWSLLSLNFLPIFSQFSIPTSNHLYCWPESNWFQIKETILKLRFHFFTQSCTYDGLIMMIVSQVTAIQQTFGSIYQFIGSFLHSYSLIQSAQSSQCLSKLLCFGANNLDSDLIHFLYTHYDYLHDADHLLFTLAAFLKINSFLLIILLSWFWRKINLSSLRSLRSSPHPAFTITYLFFWSFSRKLLLLCEIPPFSSFILDLHSLVSFPLLPYLVISMQSLQDSDVNLACIPECMYFPQFKAYCKVGRSSQFYRLIFGSQLIHCTYEDKGVKLTWKIFSSPPQSELNPKILIFIDLFG